jgi:hypothetical protein
MCKIILLTFWAILFGLRTLEAQSGMEVRSYSGGSYTVKDSLVFFVMDKKDSVQKIWFSLEVFNDHRWREQDNDIYTGEVKAFRYFHLKKSKWQRFVFYINNLDAELRQLHHVNIRIVLNTYPTWLKGSEQFPLRSFVIKKSL